MVMMILTLVITNGKMCLWQLATPRKETGKRDKCTRQRWRQRLNGVKREKWTKVPEKITRLSNTDHSYCMLTVLELELFFLQKKHIIEVDFDTKMVKTTHMIQKMLPQMLGWCLQCLTWHFFAKWQLWIECARISFSFPVVLVWITCGDE